MDRDIEKNVLSRESFVEGAFGKTELIFSESIFETD